MIKTKIQWTDATINFWMGCQKVSEGCKYCYLFRDKDRYGQDASKITKVSDSTVKAHLRALKEPAKIFTCSWSDFFIKEADEWRADAWKTIKNNPQHTWQILTKRPERIADNLPDDWGMGYENVWLGVTIENEKVKQERLENLYAVYQTNMKNKFFISAEPLLGHVNFLDSKVSEEIFRNAIDWVIVGGESGNDTGKHRYRPCDLNWIQNVVNQCKMVDTPVFVKQLGTHLYKEMRLSDRHGGTIEDFPNNLKIREFPKIAA